MSLARLFWLVAWGDVLILLGLMVKIATGSTDRYIVLVELVLLGLLLLLGAMMGTVALIRTPLAYWIGLALAVLPPLSYSADFLLTFVRTPGDKALKAGHGYFTGAPEQALADAVVAGDGAKVASLARQAKLNAIGWNNMTFMRLALDEGHANPVVVTALLRAGADPEQDGQYLFGSLNDGVQATSGAMITGRNEALLHAVIDTGIDLNHLDLEGNPRFLSALRWPEGLAIMLEHGAKTEAESKDGNTAIMWAVMYELWPSVDVLMAHGARLDHAAQDGKSLRDIVSEKVERYRTNRSAVPPELSALEARFR